MPTERERGMVWRKKPVTVEAVHYDGTRASFDALWAWACPSGSTLDSPVHYTGPSDDEPGDLMVQTSEGELRARPGCWIIRGVQGEYYPCQPDIFAATYEPADPAPPAPERRGAEGDILDDAGLSHAETLAGHLCRPNLLVPATDTERLLAGAVLRLRAELARAAGERDGAYTERNRLVAALARLGRSLGWRVGIAQTAIEGWDPAWRGCMYIDAPTGQMSWHFHERERDLFDGLPPYDGMWDGHSTLEKYERLAALRGAAGGDGNG